MKDIEAKIHKILFKNLDGEDNRPSTIANITSEILPLFDSKAYDQKTYQKYREAVKAINRLAELVYEANIHPVTSRNNYPELIEEAEKIQNQFKEWWDI